MARTSSQRVRIRVALVSIGAGLAILALKYVAYLVSGSTALKSDAIESVVNVVAATFALGAVVFADKPADKEHPYGHGKIEHFSAAFEGGLISLAAVLIAWEALSALWAQWHGLVQLKDLGLGLSLNLGAGLLNGLLGWWLVKMGRRQHSKALEADGQHVLSDFWTTLGIAGGLFLVKLTGFHVLDPLMAMVVAAHLAATGFRLVKASSQALLDMEDPEVLASLVKVMNQVRPTDLVAVHELRTLRSGRYTHVDIHMVLPEFYTIAEGHDLADRFGKQTLAAAGIEGELHTHVDPCQRAWCTGCALADCPVRQAPLAYQRPITLDHALEPGAV